VCELVGKTSPEFISAFAADAGQQLHNPFERKFVARVVDEFEIGGGVLDVRLLEETDAAGDAERDVATREFELKVQSGKVRAVEDGNFVQVTAFLAEFEGPLCDEGSLLRGVTTHNLRRLVAGFAGGSELLRELVDVCGDGGVSNAQDFRRAAI